MADSSPVKLSFPRRSRLLREADFDRVFRQGRRSADQWFTILFCASAGGGPRLGLALAKRRLRLACQRNRIKRIVRESFRGASAGLPAVDVVVMASQAAGGASNAELFASLERHWKRIAGAAG